MVVGYCPDTKGHYCTFGDILPYKSMLVHRPHVWSLVILPSCTMEASLQRGGFWVRFRSIAPNLMFGVFGRKNLPSNSGRQPRATAAVCVVLGLA